MLSLLAIALTLPPDSAFTPFHEDQQVVVTIAKKPDPLPWVRGTGPIPGSVEQAAKLLSDVANYKTLFAEMIETSTIVEKAADSVRVHLVWPFPIFYSDRDAVVTYAPSTKDKNFTLKWKRTDKKGDPSDGTRIDRVEGQTVVSQVEGKTQMTYTYYGDLGADFSKGIRTSAYKKEPIKYFENVRKALTPSAK